VILRRLMQSFARNDDGAAAIELAGVGSILVIAAINATDVGRYAYQTSEVNAAAQAGAQAASVACDVAHTPATQNCADLNGAVTTAIESTPLGPGVSLNGSITEAYYCLDNSGALQKVSAASAKPANCSAVNNANATPTLFLQVPVTYTFQPLFPGLTFAQSFSGAITRTAWMRMA
jgi:Flp pilus assembly protein TadG